MPYLVYPYDITSSPEAALQLATNWEDLNMAARVSISDFLMPPACCLTHSTALLGDRLHDSNRKEPQKKRLFPDAWENPRDSQKDKSISPLCQHIYSLTSVTSWSVRVCVCGGGGFVSWSSNSPIFGQQSVSLTAGYSPVTGSEVPSRNGFQFCKRT